MSINKLRPHIWVLPEDDANRQIATEFLLRVESNQQARVLEPAGGWGKVLDEFKSMHAVKMEKYKERLLVLLIDSDDDVHRIENSKAEIRKNLADRVSIADRVFIIGALDEPEDLKRSGLGSFEDIGSKMAQDCRDNTNTLWGHELLQHNSAELARLRQHVRPILFPTT